MTSAMAESSATKTHVNALKAATSRLWMHRDALRRVSVRIGFWPDGFVISATVAARDDEELTGSPPPHVIPWEKLPAISEQSLIAIVDGLCNPLYELLDVKRAS